MRKEVNNLLVTLKNPTTVEKSHYFSNAKPLKQWQVKRHDLEKKKKSTGKENRKHKKRKCRDSDWNSVGNQ